MDSGIEKIKSLLNEGYKIISKEIRVINAQNGQRIHHKIELKKEGNSQFVESDTPEFDEYMHHFVHVVNEYDNEEFVYVEDPTLYYKMKKEQYEFTPLENCHTLKISGRIFSDGVMTIGFKPSGPKNSKGVAQFLINLDKNPEFKHVDFKDELEVVDKNGKTIFKGYVKNYNSSDGIGNIVVQDFSVLLEKSKCSVEFGKKMKLEDILALIVEPVGITSAKPATKEREFVVILPILNLKTDQSFKIGVVEFYNKFESEDDAFISQSNQGKKNPLWTSIPTRAKVAVKAYGYYGAIQKGYKIIAKAIDVISLRTDISFPSLKIGDSVTNYPFSYYKHFTRVKMPTWIYCRELGTNAYVIYDNKLLIDNELSLEIDPQSYFKEVNDQFNNLITKTEPSPEENKLLQTLRWLRRAIQEGDNNDKLIYLWIAFEFLVSGVKSEKIFSSADINKLNDLIDKTEFSSEQKDAIKSKMNKLLNDSPLLARFNALVASLQIEFTESETNILRKARKNRDDIIHGKKEVTVTDEEVNKMKTIIEKVLIEKISRLNQK